MMKTPEEINASNRETFEARDERLRRLLESHPATWTAEDACFYADYCRRALNSDHWCALNFDQGLKPAF